MAPFRVSENVDETPWHEGVLPGTSFWSVRVALLLGLASLVREPEELVLPDFF